jgi:hypothetical protein
MEQAQNIPYSIVKYESICLILIPTKRSFNNIRHGRATVVPDVKSPPPCDFNAYQNPRHSHC